MMATPFVDPPPKGWQWGTAGEPRLVRVPPLDRDLITRIKPVALRVREEVAALPLKYPFPPDMQGACACVSFGVRHALRRLGMPAEFALAEFPFLGGIQHAWVEVGDLVVDATATQFARVARVHFARRYSEHPFRYFAHRRERDAFKAVREITLASNRDPMDGEHLPSRAQLRRIARKAAGQ